MRTPEGQSKHDSVVAQRARELTIEGDRVCADVEGFQKPTEILGYVPDIVATGQSNLLVEVETADSFSDPRTQRQLQAFDHVPNYRLEILIPESIYFSAISLYMTNWGITVDSWRTYR